MRVLLTAVLFLSIASAGCSIGYLFTYDVMPWKWPASGQVAWVLSTVLLTALMYGLLGINRPEDGMEQFDDRR